MSSFGSMYIESLLSKKGMDNDYINYIMSMLVDGCEKDDLFSWMSQVYDGEDCLDVVNDIYDRYYNHLYSNSQPQQLQNDVVMLSSSESHEVIHEPATITLSSMTTIPLNNVNVSTDHVSPDDNDHIDDITGAIYDDKGGIDDIVAFSLSLLDDVDDIDDPEDEFDYSESIDWVQMAFGVEEILGKEFPSLQFSYPVIFDMLSRFNGDVSRAAQVIIQAQHAVNKCKPCRHHLTSRCLRRDCMFDHDVSRVPCRYWLLSVGCSATSNHGICPFLHELCTESLDDRTLRAPTISKDSIDLSFDQSFPVLPQRTTVKGTSDKLASVPTKEPNISSSILSRGQTIRIGPVSYSTFSRQQSARQSSLGSGTRKTDNEPNLQNPTQAVAAVVRGLAWYNAPLGEATFTRTESGSMWVATGAAVKASYLEARQQAIQAAKARNALLDNATKAFIGGSKQLAKDLSFQGQRMNLQMKELHSQAAKIIFCRRNSIAVIGNGMIDMHGLHTAEAEVCVEEVVCALSALRALFIQSSSTARQHYIRQLLEMPNNPGPRVLNAFTSPTSVILTTGKVTLITGSGHHSTGVAIPGQVARVLDRVRGVLDALGYSYVDCKDARGFVGSLSVKL